MPAPVPAIDATNPPSPKTLGATGASFVITAALAALLYLQTTDGQQLYAALPILLVVVLNSLITGLVTFLVSYQLTDPQRILDLATSPKTLAATVWAVLVTAGIDLINFVLSNQGAGLYATWPPIAVVALKAVLPAVAAFLAGFLTSDPARLTSKNPDPVATKPPVLEPPAAPGGDEDQDEGDDR